MICNLQVSSSHWPVIQELMRVLILTTNYNDNDDNSSWVSELQLYVLVVISIKILGKAFPTIAAGTTMPKTIHLLHLHLQAARSTERPALNFNRKGRVYLLLVPAVNAASP